ncbi:MAG: hypothetical protein NTY45_15005 [Elusimicrobia bacterium]|nr:hypothetical protein [Elusimicrobiota bacterium]
MKNRKGFLLVAVLLALLMLMIIVPVMVKWVQNDTKLSVKDQKSSIAFSLAEAAVDRGYWKVKSSTSTFNQVSLGTPLTGYNFDATYRDITGGNYRIKITSGPGDSQITIYGEGRDTLNQETRAIKAVYTNTSVPGAIVSGGTLTAGEASVVHWGPVMAIGDITVTGGATVNGYPRKLSMGTVLPFDTNGTNPPNTDSLEWWSNYNVPELPVFDFTTMRSSAAQTGTLNCQNATPYACVGKDCTASTTDGPCTCAAKHCHGSTCATHTSCTCSGSGSSKVCTGTGCLADGTSCVCTEKTCTGNGCYDNGTVCACSPLQCCSSTVYGGAVTCAYGGTGCTNCVVNSLYEQPTLRDKDYTWFWDVNANWVGRNGLKGTIVVKGDLSIDGGDYYYSGGTVKMPPNAWKEYQKYDTSAVNQYPGDAGLRKNNATYTFGSNASASCSGSPSRITSGELWRMPCGTSGLGADLGVYGFVYVAGDFIRTGDSDIYGSMWVVGNVSGSGNTMVMYNSQLKVPTLNVVLTKDSWQETSADSQAWN